MTTQKRTETEASLELTHENMRRSKTMVLRAQILDKLQTPVKFTMKRVHKNKPELVRPIQLSN